MTVKEAIQTLKKPSEYAKISNIDNEEEIAYSTDFVKAIEIAIESMEEVEQYRALGTVEELKEAREKQVAKKPINNECPICEEPIPRWDTRYCPDCGQKIDWEEGGTSD